MNVKEICCLGASTLLLLLFAGRGLAQSSTITRTITTYAGNPFPVSGARATTQAIEYPFSVIPDGAGGFYFSSYAQNRVYRVAAETSPHDAMPIEDAGHLAHDPRLFFLQSS